MQDQPQAAWRDAGFHAASRAYSAALIVLAGAFALSGITTVQPDEVALVQRFGRWVRSGRSVVVNRPGALLAWPRPIDTIIRVPVQQELVLAIDAFHDLVSPSVQDAATEDGETPESPFPLRYVLTGDQNVLQLRVVARIRVIDAEAYVTNHADPRQAIKTLVMSAVTTTVNGWNSDDVLRLHQGPATLVEAVQNTARELLTRIELGVELTGLEFEEISPPGPIRESFLAVHEARVDQETLRETARTDAAAQVVANEILARQYIADARGKQSSRRAAAHNEIALFEAALAAAEGPLGRQVREQLRQDTWRAVLRQARQVLVVPATGTPGPVRLTVPHPEESR